MRIHTDTLSTTDIMAAANYARGAGHGYVYVEDVARHGSRSRAYAFAVKLTGDGSTSRRRNASNSDFHATYDSWGWFVAYLFAVDPSAIVGPYNGADDFRRKTGNVYPEPASTSL